MGSSLIGLKSKLLSVTGLTRTGIRPSSAHFLNVFWLMPRTSAALAILTYSSSFFQPDRDKPGAPALRSEPAIPTPANSRIRIRRVDRPCRIIRCLVDIRSARQLVPRLRPGNNYPRSSALPKNTGSSIVCDEAEFRGYAVPNGVWDRGLNLSP